MTPTLPSIHTAVEPARADSAPDEGRPLALAGTYVLSRFAYVRRVEDALVLASPLTTCRISLNSLALVSALLLLREPVDLKALLAEHDPEAARRIEAVLSVLVRHGFLVEVEGNGRAADTQGSLQTWEFHDLLFHTGSREGRTHQPVGGTYRFGTLAPPPPRIYPESTRYYLPEVSATARRAEHVSFADAVEARCSTRQFDVRPLSAAELSEFLHWTCRTRPGARAGGKARRPYPSGGARYPLEVYALIDRVEGVPRGLHHYDPDGHTLFRLETDPRLTARMQQDAQRAASLEATPPVLFIIAARFERTAAKYQSIAYSLILKEVGALYQSMWLAAAAMGLGACGLGTGNADVFAAAAARDYYDETSVGELVLGPLLDCPAKNQATMP